MNLRIISHNNMSVRQNGDVRADNFFYGGRNACVSYCIYTDVLILFGIRIATALGEMPYCACL
jgi:hypothetical protein